jgi:hypothetical protein
MKLNKSKVYCFGRLDFHCGESRHLLIKTIHVLSIVSLMVLRLKEIEESLVDFSKPSTLVRVSRLSTTIQRLA